VRSIIKLVAIAALVAPVILAQKKATAADDDTGPVQVKRVPPPKAASSPAANIGEALETPNQRRKRLAAKGAAVPATVPAAVPAPDQYPFTDAIDALQEPAPAAPNQRLTWSAPPETSTQKAQAPKGYQPKTTVAPSATGRDAVALSEGWQNTRNTPAEGENGRVVFSDGAGLPTVVCAPLRLCIVELQTGEKLTGEPQIGDLPRWKIEPASYGTGELTTPMIVIKPTAVGLDTNLVITTDRRAYYLRLMSSAQNYVAKISFDYPDDNRVKWSGALQKQAQDAREAQFDKGVKTLADSVEELNVDYRISGDESIRPIRVLDDGAHTYIQMNPGVLHREAPVLAVIGPDGKAEMVNYRVQGSVYVVDRLFDRGRLILGSGRKALKADIIRGATTDRRLFARDPFRDLSTADQKNQDKSQ
jgi:type IV secretion system protein TrbG